MYRRAENKVRTFLIARMANEIAHYDMQALQIIDNNLIVKEIIKT